jgi:hypothetical protein
MIRTRRRKKYVLIKSKQTACPRKSSSSYARNLGRTNSSWTLTVNQRKKKMFLRNPLKLFLLVKNSTKIYLIPY